jgi:hypothetical protein
VSRLRCISAQAACEAAEFLRSNGIEDATADGVVVAMNLTAGSVIWFAEDALAHGWAHDPDCARIIGDLG